MRQITVDSDRCVKKYWDQISVAVVWNILIKDLTLSELLARMIYFEPQSKALVFHGGKGFDISW